VLSAIITKGKAILHICKSDQSYWRYIFQDKIFHINYNEQLKIDQKEHYNQDRWVSARYIFHLNNTYSYNKLSFNQQILNVSLNIKRLIPHCFKIIVLLWLYLNHIQILILNQLIASLKQLRDRPTYKTISCHILMHIII
jgi:hypothetical protein